jgi:hypothetical protein
MVSYVQYSRVTLVDYLLILYNTIVIKGYPVAILYLFWGASLKLLQTSRTGLEELLVLTLNQDLQAFNMKHLSLIFFLTSCISR